jgi:serine/threonine protein kinase
MHGLEIGQRFERYRVLRVLGSGVSGTSYEAEDLMLHRKVTLKLIHPWSTLADSARRQFFRDMQSISLLVHPYHVAILDYGEVEGQLYVVRNFVTNGSLLSPEGRAWFSPPLSITDTLSYAHQLAQVLYNIHRYGYIHGSLTLSNILVLHGTPIEGETDLAPFLLSDIGLAYFVRSFGHPQITRLPITAAPEQWRGRHLPASDQYALAILVYLWLTGRPPFIGSPEEIEQMKYKAIFPTISSFNPHITLEQEGIIRRALSTHPDERYPTILAFIETLQNSLVKQAKTQAYELSTPVVTDLPVFPREIPETPVPLIEIEPNNAQSPVEIEPEESDLVVATHNAINENVEPLSSTFLLDQDAIRLLTAFAQQKHLSSEPNPTPPIKLDSPLLQPETTPILSPDPQSDPQEASEQSPTPANSAIILTIASLSASQEIHLEKEEITLGRAESSDILLDEDPLMSLHHAKLVRKDDKYYLYDLHSDLGIMVNEQKLTPEVGFPLADGDRIHICSYTMTLHCTPIQNDYKQKKEPTKAFRLTRWS